LRYISLILSVTLGFWLLPFAILRLPGWDRWGALGYSRFVDRTFTASGIDAEIVLYGDSSAMAGIDPHQMESALGLKAVNLPNTISNLQVMGDLGLQRYLQHNKPPRLIVFYLEPWNLDFLHMPPNPLRYEAEEFLARHGSLSQMLAFARKNQRSALRFPFRFYQIHHPPTLIRGLRQPVLPPLSASLGHLSFPGPPLPTPCEFPSLLLAEGASTTSTRTLLDRYTTPQTRTLAFVAPIPACANANPIHDRSYQALAAIAPNLIDPGSVTNDGFYSHLQPAAVAQATTDLIQALHPVLASRSASP
jgi:hypothetical protein